MASIVSPIFTVVDTVMWSCTQIVYGGIYLFQINIHLVSMVLLGLDFIFHQLLSSLYMICYALASVVQSLAYGTTNFIDLMFSLADGSVLLLNYIQEGGIVLVTWLVFLVPNTFRAIYTLILWIQQAVVFLAYNILPVLEQAGTLVIAGLKSLISYSAHFTVIVAMSITTLFTLLIHGLYKLFALTVYTVYSALNETYQFVIGGSSKPHETDQGSWPKRDENENPFWNVHLDGLHQEPVTVFDSVQDTVSQFIFQIFEVMSYLAICIAVICAVIAVVTLFYCLYRNAMSSVNALVSLFHRSLFRSERSIIMDMPTVPPQAVPVAPGLLRENLDDLSDAESEDSIRVTRTIRTTPIPVLPVISNDIPGPSRYRAPPRSRSQTPARSRSQTPKTSQLPRLDKLSAPGSPGVLARDLRRQLEEERDRKLCVVCQDNDKNILIFPCKHLCVCIECIDEIASSSIDRRKCPLCRGRISSYLEVYA